MRLTISEFMSLDGVIQAPGGADEDRDGGFDHGGWSMPFFDPATMGAAYTELLATTDALLFGRRTWQTMAAAWPGRAGDPFADQMNALPKYVVTRSLGPADLTWTNSVALAGDDAVGEVRRLLGEREGHLVLMGSATLARALIGSDLVDAYRLMLEPVTLGGGKRLFPDDGRLRPLRLVSSRTSATGVQICHYEPAHVA
ncbi:MAG TPA: dihydrofolate reductase family protein [Acidimicrobiales bacterium]|nr:dihydrofolate reductase family protein [Acidimicrobiales bacterium]